MSPGFKLLLVVLWSLIWIGAMVWYMVQASETNSHSTNPFVVLGVAVAGLVVNFFILVHRIDEEPLGRDG